MDALPLVQSSERTLGLTGHLSPTPSRLRFQEEDTVSNLGKPTFPRGDLFSIQALQLVP